LNAIADPETDAGTGLYTDLIDTDKSTSDGWRRKLGDIEGNESTGSTDTLDYCQ
jgi:hypothetical protein